MATACNDTGSAQEFGVDIFFSAHEHSYERTYPVMQGKFELHPNHTYTNPAKPVVRASAPPSSLRAVTNR